MAPFWHQSTTNERSLFMSKSILIDKGIILKNGEICKDKINLVSGAITQPFAEMVWASTGGDKETINRFTDILVTMNNDTERDRLFNIITERCNHKITMLKPIPKNKKIKMILNCKRKSVYSFLLLFILF